MSDPVLNFHDAMLLITAYQCLLFVLILSAKHDRHISDYFLIGFFIAQIAIPVHILIVYGEAFRFIALETSPNLFHIFDIALWLEGPLLLWYTHSLLYKDFRLSRIDVIYIIPALAFLIYIIVTFYTLDTTDKTEYLIRYQNRIAPTWSHFIEATREALRVFFSVLCLYDIIQARKQIRDRYSSIDKINFGWLSFLLIGFMLARIWAFTVAIVAMISPRINSEIFNIMGLTSNYTNFVLISTLILFSLTRSTIFEGKVSKKPVAAHNDETKLDPALTKRIENHMTDKKPYLSHFLNLEELANQLSMHPRTLSITIKKHFNTNFYEFVNSYRIEEAKRMLEDPDQASKTMIDILGECGFNSKATYNTFFKKLVGSTPSQYRAKKLNPEASKI